MEEQGREQGRRGEGLWRRCMVITKTMATSYLRMKPKTWSPALKPLSSERTTRPTPRLARLVGRSVSEIGQDKSKRACSRLAKLERGLASQEFSDNP